MLSLDARVSWSMFFLLLYFSLKCLLAVYYHRVQEWGLYYLRRSWLQFAMFGINKPVTIGQSSQDGDKHDKPYPTTEGMSRLFESMGNLLLDRCRGSRSWVLLGYHQDLPTKTISSDVRFRTNFLLLCMFTD